MMRFTEKMEEQINEIFVQYDRPDSPGFAVGIICDGRFVYERGFGQATLEHPSQITSNTVFDIGSMAKQFVGMAIALLEEDGQLKISDTIGKYLPEFPDYAHRVTIADLLYHTSGIRNYTVLAYYMIGYHESDAITKEELSELLVKQKSLSFEPGERRQYSDSNYFLLAQIIENISGETLDRFAKTNIFSPLAMDQTLFREYHSQVVRNRAMSYVPYAIAFRSPCEYRRVGEPPNQYHTLISNYEHVGAEGLYTTLRDLFKWDKNFSENHLGKREPSLIDRILTSGRLRNGESTGYGYGINIGTLEGERYFGHDGAIHGYTSSMIHFPERDTTIICLGNHNTVGSWVYRDLIKDSLFPSSPSSSPVSISTHPSMTDKDARAITGAYQNSDTASIWEVRNRNGKIFVLVNRSWEFEIVPVRDFVFRPSQQDIDMELNFVTEDMGRIQKIHGFKSGESFTMEAFLSQPLGIDKLAEYTGMFHSEELQTTFIVDVIGHKLRLRNKNRHFCSMDLTYEPTIKDSFISYDPHLVSSQVTFLRESGQIKAFVYRDYDGDKREDLKFQKR